VAVQPMKQLFWVVLLPPIRPLCPRPIIPYFFLYILPPYPLPCRRRWVCCHQASLRRAAPGAQPLHGHHRSPLQPPAQEHQAWQGRRHALAGQEATCARHCNEPSRPPPWRRARQVQGSHLTDALGQAHQGIQDAAQPTHRLGHPSVKAQGQKGMIGVGGTANCVLPFFSFCACLSWEGNYGPCIMNGQTLTKRCTRTAGKGPAYYGSQMFIPTRKFHLQLETRFHSILQA
jgi:hypothetical protein